jgi:uncharacterized protein (TIGR03435 family)
MTRILSVLFVLASALGGQSFEVASIRLHTAEPVTRIGFSNSGPRFTAEAVTLTNFITYAYDIKDYQVSGAPDWAATDRYDIVAKAEGDGLLTRDQAKAMLRTLLAERFHLKLHQDMKEMPVYALVVAKTGIKLKESPPDSVSLLRMGGGKGIELTVTKGSMAQLVGQISNKNGVDRPVLDKTQLTDNYDYKLTWSARLDASGNDPDVVSIFTALQEQLGLRLEPQKAPIGIWVIDHAEKPAQN